MYPVGHYVIVRTYSAGVHAGVLVRRNGREVLLYDARRVWSWKGANTLHELANSGPGAGSNVSVSVEAIELTEAIEIIVTSKVGEAKMRAAAWSR